MPNIFTRWLNKPNRLRPAPHLGAVARHNGYSFPTLEDRHRQAQTYLASPWVYYAVNRIAEACAHVPLQLLDEARQPLPNAHPLARLLQHPNPTLSAFDLIEQTIGSLELTGNAYWFLAGSAGIPQEIWVLRADRVAIVPDETDFVRGYVYQVNGQRLPLERVEVIHFKRWHPLDDYYGASPLLAGQVAITSDRAMAEWNRNTFGQENGIPAGIVTLPPTLSDTDYERVQREWRSSYGGTQRKTAFLRGESVKWQSITHSHTDLDFLQGRKAHRDEILNLFGIPVGMVSDNATEANAKVAERLFIERTLYPKLVRLASKITTELLPFWSTEWVALFDDIRPTDIHARLEEIRTAAQFMSVEEIRQRFYS